MKKYILIVKLIKHKQQCLKLLELELTDKQYCDYIKAHEYEKLNNRLNGKYNGIF